MNDVQTIKTKSGTAVTLRPATAEDAKGISEAVRSSAEERSSLIIEMHGRNMGAERQFIEGLNRQDNLLMVAVADTRVIGCLAAFRITNWENSALRTVEVGLHLRDGYRGSGIGSAMLAYAIEWARDHRFNKMVTNIFTTNKRSAGLFTRHGFAEVASRDIQASSSTGLNKLLLARNL